MLVLGFVTSFNIKIEGKDMVYIIYERQERPKGSYNTEAIMSIWEASHIVELYTSYQ
jgi:hypothetical protein